ncbi:MAG: type II toxin-antitoxin system RelE/ParE family toxin [Gemmataceae bacterium]|nr:type II toxin-antitoxin system RelE/ParE family toxin [Gemmataceae bacterium]
MDYEVVWTDAAVADLQRETEYIAQDNPTAADRMARAIGERVDLLKTLPLMGATYPKGSKSRTRTIVSGKYRIFYCVIEAARRVEILTVWHGRRQEPDLPSE